MTIRGVTGEIRWSYLPAAVVGPWRVETDATGADLTATIASVDDYRLGQSDLRAVLHVGRSSAVYPVESLTVTGSEVRARLGPQQRKDRA